MRAYARTAGDIFLVDFALFSLGPVVVGVLGVCFVEVHGAVLPVDPSSAGTGSPRGWRNRDSTFHENTPCLQEPRHIFVSEPPTMPEQIFPVV